MARRSERPPKVCLFAWLSSPALFDVVDFYRTDIAIFRQLGFDVQLASRPVEISWNADLYVTWWWGGGFPALVPSILRRRKNLFFGAHHFFQPGWDFRADRFEFRTFAKRVMMRLSLRLADANVFISEEEFGIREHMRVRNPQLIRLAVDYDWYRPAYGSPRSHLLTVSHLTAPNVRRKMICELVEAFALVLKQHPTETLVIVGEKCDGYPMVRETVDRLGLTAKVRFVGQVDSDTKRHLMQTAKLYVQPSHYEGFGLAIAEAMACEVPVVVTEGGAVRETVGVNGLYASDHTPAAIAAACNQLLERPALAASLGKRGRQHVIASFSYESRKTQIQALLESVST